MQFLIADRSGNTKFLRERLVIFMAQPVLENYQKFNSLRYLYKTNTLSSFTKAFKSLQSFTNQIAKYFETYKSLKIKVMVC